MVSELPLHGWVEFLYAELPSFSVSQQSFGLFLVRIAVKKIFSSRILKGHGIHRLIFCLGTTGKFKFSTFLRDVLLL